MDYLSVKEIAELWGVSIRMVNYYLNTGRIQGGNPEIGRVADSGEYAASGGFTQERAARAGKNPPADGKVLYAADFPPV